MITRILQSIALCLWGTALLSAADQGAGQSANLLAAQTQQQPKVSVDADGKVVVEGMDSDGVTIRRVKGSSSGKRYVVRHGGGCGGSPGIEGATEVDSVDDLPDHVREALKKLNGKEGRATVIQDGGCHSRPGKRGRRTSR